MRIPFRAYQGHRSNVRPPYTLAELRARARERIKDGRLPCEHGALLAGYDGIEPCALCGRQIDAGEIAYEVEVPSQADKRSLCFHIRCHEAWQSECADRFDRTLN